MPDYIEQFWVNGPDGDTPLDAARLNHMEDGIAAASVDELIVLEVGQPVPGGTPAGTVVVQKLA